MKKLTEKSELNTYLEFLRKVSHDSHYYDDELKLLPGNIQEAIKTDVGVFPHHLSKELFRELLIEFLQRLKHDYKIDPNSDSIIDSICNYFTRDEKFLKDDSFSFDKGILLMGRVGCGKTLLFKGLAELLSVFQYKNPHGFGFKDIRFTMLNSYSFSEGFEKEGFKIFGEGLYINGNMVHPMCPRLIIDDIGAENIVNHFGSVTNIIGEVFLRRYESTYKTYGTTNLDPKNLKAFYGERVYSRMVEMMNFLIYEGNDRRH